MKFLLKYKKASIMVALLIIFFGGVITYKISQRQPADGARAEMLSVQSKVQKLAIVPKDEEPTLATVSDKKALKDSFLAANADNGDKVLVYVKAKKVIIYRPSVNKIVGTGPLTVDASASEISGARITVRTGNGKDDISKKLQTLLKVNYQSAKIDSIDKANRQTYPTTIVIDLTDGDKYDLVTNIMGVIGGQRGVLPNGETKPDNTDILVITGTDKQNL